MRRRPRLNILFPLRGKGAAAREGALLAKAKLARQAGQPPEKKAAALSCGIGYGLRKTAIEKLAKLNG